MSNQGTLNFDWRNWRWTDEEGSTGSPTLTIDEISGTTSTTERRNRTRRNSGQEEDDIDLGHRAIKGLTVGLALKAKFAELIENYPYGVSVDMFISIFHKKHGYYPNYAAFYFTSFEKLCRSLSDVFFVVNSPLGSEALLFPANLKGTVETPLAIFFKMWERINTMLAEHGYILKIEEIPTKMLLYYKERVCPSEWNLGDEYAFYNFCLEKWPDEKMHLAQDKNDPMQKVLVKAEWGFTLPMYYHRLRGESLRARGITGIPNEPDVFKGLLESSVIGSQFVRFGQELPSVADDIVQGNYYTCLAGSIVTPGNFYVNILHNWNDLEELMVRMQNAYKPYEHEKNPTLPSHDNLKTGQYVAAKRELDGQWHRSRIIRRLDIETYEVINVDYGDVEKVERKNIRYLVKELFHRMKSQAIRCVVKLGVHYNVNVPKADKHLFDKGEGWTENEGNLLRNIVDNKDIVVKFVSRVSYFKTPAWHVFVHILDPNSGSIKGTGFHVERKVMNMSRGIYAVSEEDETDRHNNVPIVSKRDFLAGA